MRGITIRIERAAAVRELGAAIRTKTQEFEKQKSAHPKHLDSLRKVAMKAVQIRTKKILQAETMEQIRDLVREDLLPWKEINKFPTTPTLNVCQEKEFLTMLQRDVRKVIPINSNHSLWALLQSKCEVITA